MNHHLDDARLNDFADDLLPGPERARAEEHLASCSACRDTLTKVRQLRSALAALPLEIAPPPDVLADVRARIAAAGSGRMVDTSWYARPRMLAAAAVLLVAVTAATTTLVSRAMERPPGAAVATYGAADDRPAALVAVQAMERSYEEAIAELQRALGDQQSGLSPETLRVLQENLGVIDRAVAEARAALHADPANDVLAALLRAGYERKLDVLRSVSSHGRARS